MSGIPIASGSETAPGSEAVRTPCVRARRRLFAGLVAATTLIGVAMMVDVMRAGGFTGLELVILALFTATFGWIALPFWNAVIGFTLTVLRRDPLSLAPAAAPDDAAGRRPAASRSIASRTALVMPIRNEDPARVTEGLDAMLRSLARTGHAGRFDLFLLSDTSDPASASAEEAAWAALAARTDHPGRLRYRRRAGNVGRKAGNIAEFCRRWGGRYDCMVVLDADSVMTGAALVRLAQAMEADPRAGIIQTVPIPARRTTLFGRLVQFAGCLYSPMLAAGQSFWQTDAANYWGHNAIIRVRPFTDHCGLPMLPGRPPLGGPVLSHDFVEAALMRRAGWAVCLMPSVEGSFEEAPENVVDYAARDRRWSQGSLQHLRLLAGRGLHPVSRAHFALGAAGYLSSVVWLLLLLAGSAYVLAPALGADARAAAPAGGAGPAVSLLAVTAGLLFAPKLLALVLALTGRRRQFGGAPRLLASVLLETLFAVVVAPIMMMHHARFVASVLAGRDVRWDAQAREGRTVGWRPAAAETAWITLAGAAWAGLTLYCSPAFFVWLAPIFTGLLLAAPLIRWTSSRSLGAWTRRRGLFLVPSETAPPPELQELFRPAETAPAPAPDDEVGGSDPASGSLAARGGTPRRAESGEAPA